MFPFDQPTPTAFYLVCYLGTLVLHVLPMNYVLAGSTYLAAYHGWRAIRGKQSAAHDVVAAKLRDWMPFALSVAITAGVAPLLFIQILYKESFYTANLLLFHRWMAILPILIAAFYLLYVQKLKRLDGGRGWIRAAVSLGVLACFAFVAWSWTENHLLSTQSQEVWVEQYAAAKLFYGNAELAPRLALWYLGALPTLAMILAWQLRGSDEATRPLATLALGGLAASAVAGVVYAASLAPEVRTQVFDTAWPYLVLASIAVALQAACWVIVWRGSGISGRLLVALTTAVVAATAGMTVVREARRLAAIDITTLYQAHADASEVGGLGLFVLFFAINAALIAGIVVLVRRSLSKAETA